MDALSLVHEAVLVATKPVPALVMDHLFTIPTGTWRLATCAWLWRRYGIIKSFDVIEWTCGRNIAVLSKCKVFPIALPAILTHYERGFTGALACWASRVDCQGSRVVRRRLNCNPTPRAHNLRPLREAPSTDNYRCDALLLCVLKCHSCGIDWIATNHHT